MKFFKYFLRVLLPLVVLVICFFIARNIISGKKKVKLQAAPPTISVVEAEALKKTDFRVVLTSHGTVRARTESAVVPEVSGKVVEISANLRDGGFFEEGELLIRLDPRNYAIEVALKEAELAKASQLLIEEEARAALAMRNWKRLRADKAPSPLAVRRPQLMSARAELKAAQAKLDRAELDHERTRIVAPYSGRVLEKNLDLGEYVTAGSSVARIYAVDFAEIRLPLSSRELAFVDIKDLYRAQSGEGNAHFPLADIIASHRGKDYKWKARIVRSEGAIEEKSRQLFVVAEVADPYGKKSASTTSGLPAPPLKVGAFVQARIQGHLLKNVFVVPRRALRVGTELFIIKDGLLERRKINIVWKDGENVIIDDGVKEGEMVVTTPAVYMKAGTFKIVPAGRQSPSTSKKPKQGKVANDKKILTTKPASAPPVPPAVEHSLREGKVPSGQQGSLTDKKPKQIPTTLDITLPTNQKDNFSPKDWDLSELDKRPPSAVEHSLREGKVPSPPAVEQTPLTSKKPKQGKTTLGIILPIAAPSTLTKEAAEPNGWNIPAFDSEKKEDKKEVVR